MKFVCNSWHVARRSQGFQDAFALLKIMGQRHALLRDSSGIVFSLEYRCPHRPLPLPKGKRITATIRYGYHGMTFDSAGKYVRTLRQGNTPAQVHAQTFLAVEWHGIVWGWMGGPGLDGNVDRLRYSDLRLPSNAVIDFGNIGSAKNFSEDEHDRRLWSLTLHFASPVHENDTIEQWMHPHDAAKMGAKASAKIDGLLDMTFKEDKAFHA